jgi:hypothetical protein
MRNTIRLRSILKVLPRRQKTRSTGRRLWLETLEDRSVPSITAVNDNFTTTPGAPTSLDVLANDSNPTGGLQVVSHTALSPGGPALAQNADGTFTFTSAAAGTFSFDYTASGQPQEVTVPDGSAGDQFGYSVSVSGDTTVVGATAHDAAYVFVRSGTSWSLQQELTAADTAAYDNFGRSVSVSGDTTVVAAQSQTVGSNTSQGAAYVFVRSGTTWNLQQKLTADDGAAYDGFGGSVSLSGDTAVVGAGAHKVGSNPAQGAAYVFVRSGTAWSQQQELTSAAGAAYDGFGNSVAVSGDTAVVGSASQTVGSNLAQGAAYVFVRSGTAWSQQQELIAADGGRTDYFGGSVSVSGDTALVGAPFHKVGSNYPGAAYVFVRSGTIWNLQQELTAVDASNNFGHSVSVSGDTAVVGEHLHPVGSNPYQGAAYVFVRSGTTWSLEQELTAADGVINDFFGGSVSVSGDTAVVGAPTHPAGQVGHHYGPGAVYIQNVTQATATVTVTVTKPFNFDKLGAYRPGDGSWSLDSDGTFGFNSATDQVSLHFSPPGVTAVAGDWTGTGRANVGDFSNGTWHLDLNGNALVDPGETFTFGQAGDRPVVGDWTGDGVTKLGVFRAAPDGVTGEFILDVANHKTMDASNLVFTFGLATDRIVVGDWTGGGKSEVGVFRDAASLGAPGAAVFSLDANGDHIFDGGDQVFIFGQVTDGVVIGDWNGGGISQVGVYRDGAAGWNAPGVALFSLDTNGNHHYDPGTDAVFLYGVTSDQFVAGDWNVTPPVLPAQFAAGGAGPGGAAALTDAQLAPVLQQAVADWASRGYDVSRLGSVPFAIAPLGGGLVGWTGASGITLSPDAAGWGWYAGQAAKVPADQMDLLTVVEHELGHELGLSDVDPAAHPADLMAATLATGTRRTAVG